MQIHRQHQNHIAPDAEDDMNQDGLPLLQNGVRSVKPV